MLFKNSVVPIFQRINKNLHENCQFAIPITINKGSYLYVRMQVKYISIHFLRTATHVRTQTGFPSVDVSGVGHVLRVAVEYQWIESTFINGSRVLLSIPLDFGSSVWSPTVTMTEFGLLHVDFISNYLADEEIQMCEHKCKCTH